MLEQCLMTCQLIESVLTPYQASWINQKAENKKKSRKEEKKELKKGKPKKKARESNKEKEYELV